MIYLASPYSHRSVMIRRKRFRLVRAAAAEFLQRGIHVIAPVVHGHAIWEVMNSTMDPPHGFWMEHSLNLLKRCDELYVLCLLDWQKSAGVQMEIDFALSQKMPISFWNIAPLVKEAEQLYMKEVLDASSPDRTDGCQDNDSGGGTR